MSSSIKSSLLIKAPWIFTSFGRWMEGGAVLWDCSRREIIDVLKSPKDISNSASGVGKVIELDCHALIPGLVNAHTHLELSAFRELGNTGPPPHYLVWVRNLLDLRGKTTQEALKEAFHQSLIEAFSTGTALLGDISNYPIVEVTRQQRKNTSVVSEEDIAFNSMLPYRHLFWELIGFSAYDIVDAMTMEQREIFIRIGGRFSIAPVSLVPHAVYSTSQSIIKQTFRWCHSRKRPFTIHVAELEEEVELIRDGKGIWKDFLRELGKWNDSWSPLGLTPIRYLDGLGCLDDRTLLVHCLHTDPEDWLIVKERGAFVCLCPRSNHYLNTGVLKASEIVAKKIPFLLGTDSLASVPDLNLFREAVFLLEHFPLFEPQEVLTSMTARGTSFFRPDMPPYLEKGYKGPFLAVEMSRDVSKKAIPFEVITKGAEGRFQWITEFLK